MRRNEGRDAMAIPEALGRLRVALQDAYVRASREMGLTAQQAELLCAAMRPAAVGEIADALHCDRSNVSRLVDRASARGLLRRASGDDARVTMVELTPAGERLALRFIAALEAQTADLRGRWTDKRQQTALGLLNEVAETLERRPSPASSSSAAPARAGRRRPARDCC